MYIVLQTLLLVFYFSCPKIAAPAKDATIAGNDKPTINVCSATFVTESSGMTEQAVKAPAATASPAAPISGGGTDTAVANKGKAPGAMSTIVGKSGNNSGPLASTRINISGFDAANSNNGSNLLRVIPAAWALLNRPDAATLLNKRSFSTFSNNSLTLMLLPITSTSEA